MASAESSFHSSASRRSTSWSARFTSFEETCMLKELRPALVFVAGMTLLTGLAYPLAMTGIAGAIFPAQAGGSLIRKGDQVIGSALIGQEFKSDRYFHGRPSATV